MRASTRPTRGTMRESPVCAQRRRGGDALCACAQLDSERRASAAGRRLRNSTRHSPFVSMIRPHRRPKVPTHPCALTPQHTHLLPLHPHTSLSLTSLTPSPSNSRHARTLAHSYHLVLNTSRSPISQSTSVNAPSFRFTSLSQPSASLTALPLHRPGHRGGKRFHESEFIGPFLNSC
jgi:hypothetical protein